LLLGGESLGRREKLPQKVERREKWTEKVGMREIYPPVPPPSLQALVSYKTSFRSVLFFTD